MFAISSYELRIARRFTKDSRRFQAACKQAYKPGDCAGTSLHMVESNPAPGFDGS